MKVGDNVVVVSTHVCYADSGSIGHEGIIVEVGVNGKSGRYLVRLTEAVGGYIEWIYDRVEIILGNNIPFCGSLNSYR